jgi:hypothetical protein
MIFSDRWHSASADSTTEEAMQQATRLSSTTTVRGATFMTSSKDKRSAQNHLPSQNLIWAFGLHSNHTTPPLPVLGSMSHMDTSVDHSLKPPLQNNKQGRFKKQGKLV